VKEHDLGVLPGHNWYLIRLASFTATGTKNLIPFYGSSTVLPVVFRVSSALCAVAASFRLNV
jgi:hypothetical protein